MSPTNFNIMPKAKTANAVQLTPEELAKAQAQILRQLNDQKAEIEAEIERVKSELITYVKDTGQTELGAYKVSIGEQKPKVNFGSLTANQKERVDKEIKASFPDYVQSKESVDYEGMYYAMKTQPAIGHMLNSLGVSFDLVSNYTFRKV